MLYLVRNKLKVMLMLDGLRFETPTLITCPSPLEIEIVRSYFRQEGIDLEECVRNMANYAYGHIVGKRSECAYVDIVVNNTDTNRVLQLKVE